MNLRELKEIFRLVEKTDFTSVEIAQGDWKVSIERGKGELSHVAHASPSMAAFEMSQRSAYAPEPPKSGGSLIPQKEGAVSAQEKGHFVTSPFVGTFYRSPSPDADPYVEVGQTVKKGQVLCIVEAMKLMNEIESDYDGRIAEIYVQNVQAVEFGEKLIRIDPL